MGYGGNRLHWSDKPSFDGRTLIHRGDSGIRDEVRGIGMPHDGGWRLCILDLGITRGVNVRLAESYLLRQSLTFCEHECQGSSGTSWHKDVVGTYVSSLIYRLARTRRSPGKGSTTEIGSRARGTCVEPLAHGSAHHQRQPQQQEPPSKHPGILEQQPDEQTLSDDERVARELNLALVDAREELRESIQNRANNLTQPVVPRTYRRLRVGTIVWEKHDKAATLKTKSHKSWGNLSRATEQVSEVVYMTTSLVAPGKARKVHVDDLKLYVRRLARLEPPKVIKLELDANKEDQRQMLEDPTWDNPEIIDSMRTCEYAGRRRSHHSVRVLSTLRATDWYRQMDTGGSGGGNDGAEELGIM
ncbi:uncharacterized protein FPRO_14812 [Fusarium proliferatum ET1]|uniref:Uncharacterized protein n=1 Tax=Fusarium proliferatum (strain ET1) TaxID=1227346 RepID=A0A1L7WAS7_FUSPR|nr:uncharacterized protein FPRO_14812 [Fusarium proliferatum ET1]CZR49710.1 uncharacterized protein FPRO_14812 [Fusarium proliferatum ET1]